MCGALWGWCQASNNVYKRIVPLLDRVLVQRSKAPEKTASGLYIPEKAKNKLNEGEVVAVGPGGRDTHGNLIPVSVKVGDTVQIKESSRQLTFVLEANGLGERDVPDFLEVDHGKQSAKVSRIPNLSEVPFPVQMEPHLIVEFYSR